MRLIELLGCVAAAALSAPVVQPSAAIAQPTDFTAQAAALVEAAYPADGPGAAVIVTRGGRVIYSAGRGLADVAAGRPITPDTGFRLGSIVKQFTAATVLQLVAEGKLSLDDPLSRFFPNWPQPGADATVRQLLNHSSGLQDYSKIPGWIGRNRHRRFTTAELLALSRSLPAKAQPGHAWEYNNGAYVVLGAVIEQVTGKPWDAAMAERIMQPLGLETIAHTLPPGAAATTARGYTVNGGRPEPVQLSDLSVAGAAGGLHGSVTDMARWAHALHHGRVVSPAFYQEMIQPARLADGSTRPYGFGLRLQQIRGRPAYVHGGAGGGLDTDSVYVPSDDLFVAVFTNSDKPATDPSSLARRLAALALGEPLPIFARAPLDMAAVEPLFGVYGGGDGPPLRFFGRDGKLFLAEEDDQLEAFPAGNDSFFFGADALSWVRFIRKPDGAHEIEVHEAARAQPQRAVRTGAVPPPLSIAAAVLQSYVGSYATETVAVTVALAGDGRLTMAAGQPAMDMRPVSETEFRVDGGGGFRIVFHKEDGEVNRFTMYRGARELHGRRTGR